MAAPCSAASSGGQRIGRWRRWCVLLSLSLLCAPAVRSQAPDAASPLSRYQRTVQYLQRASAAEQVDFASDALARLAEIYLAEADLARAEARGKSPAEAARLRGWAAAVDQYADQLLLLLDDLQEGFPAGLFLDAAGATSLEVAGGRVMLVHPRPDQQGTFEQEVLASFCGRHDCLPMTAAGDADGSARPIPLGAARVSPRWTFTNAGPVCDYQRIEVHFGATRELAALRDLCTQLMQELQDLAVELDWQQRHGVAVNWAAVDIVATPGRPGHVVHLNLAGDAVLATLPLLAGSEGLLADVIPWLRARAAGDEGPALRLDAAVYGWMAGPDSP